jgi:KDO2-lipid IV(A) lauroyltransferase
MAAWLVMRYVPSLHEASKQNLRHALGPEVSEDEIESLAEATVQGLARTNFDFFNKAGKSREEVLQAVEIDHAGVSRMQAELDQGRGVLALFPHMSNFDLAGYALGASGMPIQVLTLADPDEVLREQNRLREISGMRVMPITAETLRDAIRSLQAGEIIFTGLDRPVPREDNLVEFFGQPSYLPTGVLRMARISRATVFVAVCRDVEIGKYAFDIIGPVEMVRTGRRDADVMENTRRVAKIAEGLILARPDQWLMFHPLWPAEGDRQA